MRTTLLSLVLTAAIPFAASASPVSALPEGRVKVDVMKAVTSPRAAELTEKLRSNAQLDREQWIADVRQPQTDERLGWNERLGLTREEHAELQRLGHTTALEKTAEAEVSFVRSPDGRIVLQPDASLPELTGIVIDVDHDVIQTPFGTTTERATVMASELDSWSGVEWKLDTPGDLPGTGTTVRVAIGQFHDGRGILVYDAKQVENGKMPRRENRVIVFPLQ